MKTCKKGQHKFPDEFRQCPECDKENKKIWYRINKQNLKIRYEQNKDQILKKYREKYHLNSEIRKAAFNRYKESNPEKVRAKNIAWSKANGGKVRAKNRRYMAKKLNATPKWLTKIQLAQIVSIYSVAVLMQKLIGKAIHVDHIVPLQAKEVSGLHVPWNLQLLTAKDNWSKGNKFKQPF